MKTFTCCCGNPVFFHNSLCVQCGRTLGFIPDKLEMSALKTAGQDLFLPDPSEPGGKRYRQCNNYRFEQVCNWLVEADDPSVFCRACRLNLRESPWRSSKRHTFDRQIGDWGLIAESMNAINRSMGLPDSYPFVLGDSIHDKLHFIHQVIGRAGA